jgi:phage gpG-like protein
MTPEQAFKQLDNLRANLKKQAAQVVAEKAVAYYKLSFTRKSWDGQPWQAVKNEPKRGSLMVRSGKLMASIRPILVTIEKIRIRAGSPQVPYAQIHQEGGTINHPGGTPYFFDKKKNKAIFVSKKNGANLPVTRPHKIPMPRRQYMGIGSAFAAYILAALRNIKLIK